MGAGTQGIMCPTEFCHRLASKGFFVIRYDHRDTGCSSAVNFEASPYDLMDLARDAIGLLDHLHIPKAHILGASMGGSVATLLGAYFPERVLTLMPMMATSDIGVVFDDEYAKSSLPRPKIEYLNWLKEVMAALGHGSTPEQKIEALLKGWRIENGTRTPFDEKLHRELIVESFLRTKHPGSVRNHALAIKRSLTQLKTALPLVKAPTLVLSGTDDPVFSVEHGQHLADSISCGKVHFFEGMGHNFNPLFYDPVIEAISHHVSEKMNSKS
jgi:pimeloyl-ACP methyl ester carboxylesterase